MPKTINASLLAHLTEPTVMLAVLVLITRVDGTVMGFTNWDVNIVFGGVTYLPAISMKPAGVKVNSDLTSDQTDIVGAIDSVYLTDDDLYGGRYDSASIQIMRVNPNNLAWGAIVELTGTVGNVQFGDGTFRADVNSLGRQLSQQIGDVVTPICRVKQLGDAQCKVTIASFRFSRTVLTANANNMVFTATDAHVTGYYNYGAVRFNSVGSGGGSNHDLVMEIKTSVLAAGINTITLQEPMPFDITIGDSIVLEAGCDRLGITCRNKFANLVNFHGEPYVPGNDWLARRARPPG